MRKTDFKANNSPFKANKTTAPANGPPSLFYGKLTKYNAKSDHFTSSTRFSNSVSKFSCSKNSSPPVAAKLQVGKRGDGDVVAQGCNTTGAFQRTRVIPQNVFSCKKGGGQRPALDLSPLNKFIQAEHFKMENLITIKSLITKGDHMTDIDLTDAVWPPCGTKSIYKVNETSNIMASGSGCLHDYLFK